MQKSETVPAVEDYSSQPFGGLVDKAFAENLGLHISKEELVVDLYYHDIEKARAAISDRVYTGNLEYGQFHTAREAEAEIKKGEDYTLEKGARAEKVLKDKYVKDLMALRAQVDDKMEEYASDRVYLDVRPRLPPTATVFMGGNSMTLTSRPKRALPGSDEEAKSKKRRANNGLAIDE
jgi:hypothetical protein